MPTHFPSEAQLREADPDQPLYAPIKRRSFFMYAGATAGATALVLAGCSKSDSSPGTIDVGSGDAGILNYAYALEQLEAAFYAQVKTGGYYTGTTITAAEKQIFDDLALHEAIHRDFLRAALQANSITPLKDLTPNFSSINFGDRSSVLSAAQTFEDTGVAAYNGAGRFLSSNANLALAGKIVSVEARHAALIRDLRNYNKFVDSDVVNTFTPSTPTTPGVYSGEGTPNTPANTQGNGNPGPGQERSKRPPQILQAVNNFLADGSKLSANSFA
jgi:hypothetical protein